MSPQAIVVYTIFSTLTLLHEHFLKAGYIHLSVTTSYCGVHNYHHPDHTASTLPQGWLRTPVSPQAIVVDNIYHPVPTALRLPQGWLCTAQCHHKLVW